MSVRSIGGQYCSNLCSYRYDDCEDGLGGHALFWGGIS